SVHTPCWCEYESLPGTTNASTPLIVSRTGGVSLSGLASASLANTPAVPINAAIAAAVPARKRRLFQYPCCGSSTSPPRRCRGAAYEMSWNGCGIPSGSSGGSHGPEERYTEIG